MITISPLALLEGLGAHLSATKEHFELVVVGGSGLLALGAISRATHDVDVVALWREETLQRADPLPSGLVIASDRVATDFGVPSSWLNAGPTGLLDLGLPPGFVDRLEPRRYGDGLTVHFASRVDQIHDPSPGFREMLVVALAHLGVADADL